MFKKKNNNKWIIISIALFIIGLYIPIIIFDYKISTSFDQINNWFTEGFRAAGEVFPILPSGIFLSIFLLHFLEYRNIKRKTLINVIYLILFIFISTISFLFKDISESIKNKEIDYETIILVVSTIILEMIFLLVHLYFAYGIKKERKLILQYLALKASYGALFCLLLTINVGLFKLLFGRPRPISVITDGDPYKYPFEIYFGSNRGKSFPSGHTASACVFLGLIYLIPKNYKKTIWCISVFSISMIICTALSRILIQAHFLGDVTFTMILALIYFWTSPMIIKSIQSKIQNYQIKQNSKALN